ncbi:MAG: cyclic nucleotide-binding domain-containing protein [Bacteroidetes bacterium]|nr:cyclic nucleotide-binding domain-containing protein [Bacteroidota bacterium]
MPKIKNRMIRQHIESKIGKALTDEEFDYFSSLLRNKSVAPKEVLIHAGDRCSKLYFVQKGALHSFLTDDVGNAHVVQLAFEGHWISDMYSFHMDQPALFTIETLEPCELIVFEKSAIAEACDRLHKIERFFRILAQNAYAAAQYRIARSYSADTESRYLELVDKNPDIVLRVPQFLIASYLGVKPQSLSRIRKQMAERR